MRVLVFGGTTEGRELSDFLIEKGFKVVLSVATEYGKNILMKKKNLEIVSKRLSEIEMIQYLRDFNFDYVVDTTHPYANVVTENIKYACNATNTKYVRFIRNSSEKSEFLTYVSSVEEAVNLLNSEFAIGNIFFTTGSKDLEHFTKIDNYKERCYVRIIPDVSSLKKTLELGFLGSNIICMQGPFDIEINEAMFKSTNAKYIVTKDSGNVGKFDAKIISAKNLNCEVIVITRPVIEEGYSWQELQDFFHSL